MQPVPRDEDSKRKSNFLGSQVLPSPGTQVVFWTVTDPDGDNVLATFSIRRDGDTAWTDPAVNTRDSFVQFDTAHLPDGVYFTRLVATETAPRLAADRLTVMFETDNLIVDHTPPELLEATAKRDGDRVVVAVHGRDALSLLDSIDWCSTTAFTRPWSNRTTAFGTDARSVSRSRCRSRRCPMRLPPRSRFTTPRATARRGACR